jgi:signal transduction histidine kinase
MNLPLVPAVQLTWAPDLRITGVQGELEQILQSPPAGLTGRPLEEALGISRRLAEQLDAQARGPGGVVFVDASVGGDPRWLWMNLGQADGEAAAGILALRALLVGAPPLQISALSSSLSHELRNPLSSVKMAVQTLARNQGLSERDQRRLSIANREIRTLERMLTMLSEYGRDGRPGLEPVSARALVQESAALVALELDERKTAIEIDDVPDLPRVLAEPGRFRPVLAQLLLNVAMGQPPETTVKVHLTREGDQVRVMVEDPASELPPEEEATLFEPFGSRLARGAGLSLAALKRAMLGQKGDAWARSSSPGTIFTLAFAIAAPS